MNCTQCKQYLEFVCLDCCEEICSVCDKKQIHLTHEKQKITSITKKCDQIKVQIDEEEKFNQMKGSLYNTIESSMNLMENLQLIQQQFLKMVQDAEYHCEIKRLSRKYQEGDKKKEDLDSQKDIIIKILTKSKKCDFNLQDSCKEDSTITLNQLHDQLNDQQKLSKQLETEILKLQNKIQENKLFSILELQQNNYQTERKAYNTKQKQCQIEEQYSSNITRTTRKRKGEDLDNITPYSKSIQSQSTLKINKMEKSPLTSKDAASPLLIKKLKKNLQSLY